MKRREVLWLVAGGGVTLLGGCVSAPATPPGASATAAAPANSVTGGPTAGATSAPTRGTVAAATATPNVTATVGTSATAAATANPATATPNAAATAGPGAAAATPNPAAATPNAATGAATAGPSGAPTALPTQTTPSALQAAVDAAMQRAIQRNSLPGGVALVQLEGAVIMRKAYGLARRYDSLNKVSSQPIEATVETLYDLASISKLFSTTAVMRLVEQGRLALDEPVAQWIPEFAAGGKDNVTLRQLLTHTSGLPDYLQLWKLAPTPEARVQRVLATPLINKPGTTFLYSDLGLISLGHLAEVVTGSPLDQLVKNLVTDPLRLDQTMYRPPVDLKPRIAATEDEEAVGRGMVWGEVHDENAWSLGGVAGHAGIFSTAENLGRFAQLYLEGGSLGGVRLLQASTVADMTRNQIAGIDWRGLGWELNADYYMGHLAAPETYGHTGFTGTSLVIDPRRQLVVVLLTNRVHPTRDGPSINGTRQAVSDAALAAADAA